MYRVDEDKFVAGSWYSCNPTADTCTYCDNVFCSCLSLIEYNVILILPQLLKKKRKKYLCIFLPQDKSDRARFIHLSRPETKPTLGGGGGEDCSLSEETSCFHISPSKFAIKRNFLLSFSPDLLYIILGLVTLKIALSSPLTNT